MTEAEEKFLNEFPNIKDSGFYTLKPGTVINYVGKRVIDCNDKVGDTIYVAKLVKICKPIIYNGIYYNCNVYSIQEFINTIEFEKRIKIKPDDSCFGSGVILQLTILNDMKDYEFYWDKIIQNKWELRNDNYIEIPNNK